MVKVIDACALMAYLEKEAGAQKVKELLVKASEGSNILLMTTVNWGEVFMFWLDITAFLKRKEYRGLLKPFP